jgi:hypothetical protein
MVITGMTDAPILWPIGRRGGGRRSLIVFKDLARAIRRESNQAIAYWWGIDPQAVMKWRKALRVQWANEGTRRLCQDYSAAFSCPSGRRKRLWRTQERGSQRSACHHSHALGQEKGGVSGGD